MAQPGDQVKRFEILAQASRPKGKVLADLGAGRGACSSTSQAVDQVPSKYVGVEGISEWSNPHRNVPDSSWVTADS